VTVRRRSPGAMLARDTALASWSAIAERRQRSPKCGRRRGRAEGRHASHSNTVFDDPEQFRGSPARGSETIKSNHNPSFIVITKSTAEFLLMQVGTCVFAMCVDCSLKCSSWSLLALRKPTPCPLCGPPYEPASPENEQAEGSPSVNSCGNDTRTQDQHGCDHRNIIGSGVAAVGAIAPPRI